MGAALHPVNDNGTLTQRPNATLPALSDTFTYDAANRLTSATIAGVPAATTSTSTYDGDGNRATATTGATTTHFTYDVHAGLPVLLDDGTRKYVWGPQGLAYNVSGSGANEAVEVYHADDLGNVRELSDGSGNLTTIYLTDEYGVPTTQRSTQDSILHAARLSNTSTSKAAPSAVRASTRSWGLATVATRPLPAQISAPISGSRKMSCLPPIRSTSPKALKWMATRSGSRS